MDNNHNFIQLAIWKWWRSIDQQLLIATSILIGISILLVTTASSSVAIRIGASEDFFATRHLAYVGISAVCLLLFTMLSNESAKKIAILGFIINVGLLILVKFYGYEVKGARRWINILGFSLQPSEFIKPCFAVFTGWVFSCFTHKNVSFVVSAAVYLLVAVLLIIQPDLGMLITLTGIWGVQLFIAGLPYIWIIGAFISMTIGMLLAYEFLPHVTARIDSFLNPNLHENYQVSQSLNAFKHGGLFGTGPGEGTIKHNIPDSHADFIFAVAGEEFGSVLCSFISLVFAFIVLRGIIGLIRKKDEFTILASAGILSQLALQSIINMGVSLNLLPTKGMTLPFISYGGSSTISIGIAIGMLLTFSKTNITNTRYIITKSGL